MPVSRWSAHGLVSPSRAREGGPALEVVFRSDDRRQAMTHIIRRVCARFEAVEHVDLSLRQSPARRDPLAQMGDEKDARARIPQRRRGLGEADPVGVSLDDGCASPRRRQAGELAPVVGQSAEIDRKPPRRA